MLLKQKNLTNKTIEEMVQYPEYRSTVEEICEKN